MKKSLSLRIICMPLALLMFTNMSVSAHAFLIAAAKTGPRPESVLSAEGAGMIRDALGWENGSASYLRLFDIKIVDESGEKVEIAADLSVHHPGPG